MNNKGFSIIELLAIIIILTIITLISIPVILNIVNDQKKVQNRKIVDEYGNNIEIALERYKLAHDGLTTNKFNELEDYLTIKKNVKCDTITINEDSSIHLSDCYVNGEKILNDKSESYEYNSKK